MGRKGVKRALPRVPPPKTVCDKKTSKEPPGNRGMGRGQQKIGRVGLGPNAWAGSQACEGRGGPEVAAVRVVLNTAPGGSSRGRNQKKRKGVER